MKITVTKEDIQKGRRGDPFLCPVARAIKRRCKLTGRKVVVGNSLASVLSRTLDIPKKAQKFINNFDDKRPVKPFSFNLVGA